MSTFSEMAEDWLRQQAKVERLPEEVLRADEGGSRIPPHDPAEWRESFARWLNSACVRHPRCFGGVVCLHKAFCEWEILQGEVPCTLDAFRRLLEESEFLIGEVDRVELVSGLTFREDLDAYEHFQGSDARTQAGKEVSRPWRDKRAVDELPEQTPTVERAEPRRKSR